MRTTIRLPDDLLEAAKRFAAETHRTLTGVIEDALRAALARPRGAGKGRPVRLTTAGGTGLQPGADLDDTSALLDRMDSGDAPLRQ